MRKDGLIEVGETAALTAVREGRARLVLLASDASPNIARRAESSLQGHRALLVHVPYEKLELSDVLGTGSCGVAAVTDMGLSSAFMDALGEKDPEKYGEQAQEMKRRSEKAAKRKAMGPNRKAGRNDNEHI